MFTAETMEGLGRKRKAKDPARVAQIQAKAARMNASGAFRGGGMVAHGNPNRQAAAAVRRAREAAAGQHTRAVRAARAAGMAPPPKPAAAQARPVAQSGPVAVVIPPAATFTPPEFVGTPADASPQADFDRVATGTDEGTAVDLSTDAFADATAPEGEPLDVEQYIADEAAEVLEYEGIEGLAGLPGLGFGGWLKRTLNRNKNTLSTVAPLIPGAGGVVASALSTVANRNRPGAPAPAPAPVAPRPAPAVRRVVARPAAPRPAAAAAKPFGGVPPIVWAGVGVGTLLALAMFTRQK
jgi:hypothetical protein